MGFKGFNPHIVSRLKHTWIKPEGYDTGIKIYNCITKIKEPLIVKNKNLVTWYTCGPTVYSSAHLGHASCFVKLDIIQRILKNYFKLNVVTVMNITDIDDKIIKKSKEINTNIEDLTKHFEKEFWIDMELLNIMKPNVIIRVSDNIKVIISFIEKLLNNKSAYKSSDNSIYFDLNKYKNYGKLQNVGDIQLSPTENKKAEGDFVLWKAVKPGEPSWDSPWGKGRPGWHIECSALASHLLGANIDFHAGGIDLRFPHHENEEAQSCSYHSTGQWVNYWIHTGHLHLRNSKKMSKSLGNALVIQEHINNRNTQSFRMACAMTHYRKAMEFSDELLSNAENLLKNYKNFIDNCKNYVNGHIQLNMDSSLMESLLINSANDIHKYLIDDFNTPGVINTLNSIVIAFNNMIVQHQNEIAFRNPMFVIGLSNLMQHSLNIMGIHIGDNKFVTKNDDNEIMNILNNFRQNVRLLGISTKNNDVLQLCDDVRHELKKFGITIKDFGKISTWS